MFSGGFSFDEWTIINSRKWEWEDYARSWNPKETEETFGLTPAKLKHAYEALAGQQSKLIRSPVGTNWFSSSHRANAIA